MSLLRNKRNGRHNNSFHVLPSGLDITAYNGKNAYMFSTFSLLNDPCTIPNKDLLKENVIRKQSASKTKGKITKSTLA